MSSVGVATRMDVSTVPTTAVSGVCLASDCEISLVYIIGDRVCERGARYEFE